MGITKFDGLTLSVVNWDKYNPRTDSARPTWFRFENTIATSSAFFDLDCEQKWLWILILSLVSQANGKPIRWNSSFVTSLTGISEDKQNLSIQIFIDYDRLRLTRASPARLVDETRPLRTYGRTNEHMSDDSKSESSSKDLVSKAQLGGKANKKNALHYSEEFLAFFVKYPSSRRDGKKQGYKIYQQLAKDPDALLRLEGALKNYLKQVSGKEAQYVKQFKTFMNNWDDHEPANFVPSQAPANAPGSFFSPDHEAKAAEIRERNQRALRASKIDFNQNQETAKEKQGECCDELQVPGDPGQTDPGREDAGDSGNGSDRLVGRAAAQRIDFPPGWDPIE